MKALPIVILAAFFFSGCSDQEIEGWNRAARGAIDGYYGNNRNYAQPVVVQPAPTYYQY